MFKITLATYDLDETRSMIDGLTESPIDATFAMVHITDGWEAEMNDVAIYADNMYSIRMIAETFDLDIDDIECADLPNITPDIISDK